MALNIKNPEVEDLATEVAKLAGETKTQAIKVALMKRKIELQAKAVRPPKESLREFLEREVWPMIPPDVLGKTITKEEEEEILGFGPNGY
jgi:antitoxin VapB